MEYTVTVIKSGCATTYFPGQECLMLGYIMDLIEQKIPFKFETFTKPE